MGTAAESSLGTRDVAGLPSAHWPPVADRIACPSSGRVHWPIRVDLVGDLGSCIMYKKQALQTRGSCWRGEKGRGEGTRADQRSDSLAIQKACRGSLPGARWEKTPSLCIRGPKEFEPNKVLTPFRRDEVEHSEGSQCHVVIKKKGARMLDWIVEECYPKSRQR